MIRSILSRIPSARAIPGAGKRRGSSLVVVLASLGLLLVITMAFLASVSTELQTSKMYSNSSSLKLLTQSAANMVIAQVRVATADPALCWASQPGMIRTYGTDGQPAGYFKLYTDDTMQGSGKFDHTQAANVVPANWFDKKGVYVDLNQPVKVNSNLVYPIIDGNSTSYENFNSVLDGTAKGLKPLNSGTPAVTGFWIKNTAPVDSTSPNAAPMPVKWMYVLQDGTYIMPDSTTSGGVVTFSGAAKQPSLTNPIVGRIAFWTDDDTCKVNINTASEGSYWDTPRTYTFDDYYLARNQPVANEFQRYPGHPATVSLSAVFPALTLGANFPETFYPITPRTLPGGSQGGDITNTSTTSPAEPLPLRSDRLYSSADEFLFQPSLTGAMRELNSSLEGALDYTAINRSGFFITAHSQAPDVNVFNLPRVSMWPITLNKTTGAPAMAAYDKLLAFCGTINNHVFYFQRKDPNSAVVDLPTTGSATGLERNRMLLEYLRTLTSMPIPGFGTGTFAAKYPNGDRNQILTEMFDYIRATNLQDSTAGATQYVVANDLTATSSLTYKGGLGQVVPIVDPSATAQDASDGQTKPTRGFGRYPTVHSAAFHFIGTGTTTGTAPNTTTVAANNTPAIAAGKERVQAAFYLQMFDPSQGVALAYPWYQLRIRGLENAQWSVDNGATYHSMGFGADLTLTRPYAREKGNAFSGANFGGILDFRTFSYAKNRTTGQDRYQALSLMTGTGAGKSTCPDMNSGGTFQFRCPGELTVDILALSATGTTTSVVQTIKLSFPDGRWPVPVSQTDFAAAIPAQASQVNNYTMLSFLDSTIITVPPPPALPSTTTSRNGRLNINPSYMYIHNQDVVRSIVASPGDMRLIAARTLVPSSFYKALTPANVPGLPATASYDSDTSRFSHMLRFGLAYPVYGAMGGRLFYETASGKTYSRWMNQYNFYPFAHPTPPTAANTHPLNDSTFIGGSLSHWNSKDSDVPLLNGLGTATVLRDWDNGFQNARDGAYINKADEGDTGRSGGGNSVAYFQMDYNVNTPPGDTFFSPNRMIPSAGMFGSLPSRVFANTPWQTLQFRPGPAGHPGLGTPTTTSYPPTAPYTVPPDHLLMDLFNMPVVEPYAISTPLATAGRINMNSLIVPFTYINRDTGLRAAMKSQKMTCIPNNRGDLYKTYQNPSGYSPTTGGNAPLNVQVRFPIDMDKAMRQFRSRFDSGDIFRSASEICAIDLLPSGLTTPAAPPANPTRANVDTFWNSYGYTGDNSRERPYVNLYPLLTTKSNTYTVHMRVQSLKQVAGGNAAEWREGKDLVTGQYRGSQTFERFINPADSIPDFADPSIVSTTTFPPAEPLSKYYKFRIIASNQFAP
ncbi:hypothetical protein DB346_07085 [Verrucomicrobia bacterium LW23]|nr:hypothetical protein DB346_07085 [Verrucomicrobia bacterium LW23]